MPPPTKRKSNRKRPPSRSVTPKRPLVIGPDYMQLLQGTLFSEENPIHLSLVLCGESHEDAIDVTRKGGRLTPVEGWLECSAVEGLLSDTSFLRVLDISSKSLPLGKAKEWGREVIERKLDGGPVAPESVALVWVRQGEGGKKETGRCLVTEIYDSDELDEEDVEEEGWIQQNQLGERLPSPFASTFVDSSGADKSTHVLIWGDLDEQARDLNRRRLSEEEIPPEELDAIVNQRKEVRRTQDGIWTWDDWFAQLQTKARSLRDDKDVYLVLEGTVPPWEVELHRPKVNSQDVASMALPVAPDFLRMVPEDEEEPDEEGMDPSSDGVGSFLDFIYRRFMHQMMSEQSDKDNLRSDWLFCVDIRDLGCQGASHAPEIQSKWNSMLLTEAERGRIDPKAIASLEVDPVSFEIMFLPETQMSTERVALKKMIDDGTIALDDEGSHDADEDQEITFPSMEAFFGQNTEFLYYSPHMNICYSPFLGRCIKSLERWESFYTSMFFGGTIQEAMSFVDQSQRECFYVRSPIQQTPDGYVHRDDGEHYITSPFFPYLFHLVAKDSSPKRTWTSNLFVQLGNCSSAGPIELAMKAREWILKGIRHHADDPKAGDDELCGGEWFEAYLRVVHRDIYDDIDRSDPTVLLRKNYMKSMTTNRKHNLGKIKVPSVKDAFDEIEQHFGSDMPPSDVINPRIEVLSKILIDIWTSSLVDFVSILKIIEAVSKAEQAGKKEVVVVCYMGSGHTRAISKFALEEMGLMRKAFVGKFDWEDENEPRTLSLPENLWDVSKP